MSQPRDLQAALRHTVRALVAIGVLTLWVAGCSPQPAAPPATPGTSPSPGSPAGASHGKHGGGGHGAHGDHEAHSMNRQLTISLQPAKPGPGEEVKLVLTIPGDDGKPISHFKPLHEKLAHLIMIREGLDEFAHVHPEVSEEGRLSVEHTFPKAGLYRLFVDYQPHGEEASMASGELVVAGDSPPAPELVANISKELSDGDVHGRAELAASNGAAMLQFRLTDASGKPLADLQPYLGAMGHLVLVSAQGMEYVHAHPRGEAKSAPDGVVEFEAHLSKPGLYKAWGQFQHRDRIVTLPVIFEYHPQHQ